MSYQVLARKWRPRSFREMVGQAHVLKALINALDNQRLHHAYLFTGTRGVGKTTIARIIAKCLNCETGITSTPCGTCSVCREIDEGRFVDLIEIDAASRTKVEDTRELLDNVQYAPSRGRFKVYLIDEVHMLSTHSFNALLKTLEEPPPYVKFILATTDPQKLPATILSRCLQFSLKNMSPERVVEHLSHVLTAESVPFEPDALWLLGRAADGSMRDAMSLTDQAIAFGEGKVLAADVRAMLGSLDHGQVYGVLQALLEGDARALLEAVRNLAEQGPDWSGVLAEMLNVRHRVAIAQALPEAVDNGQGDRDRVLALASALPAEDVQFYYQMGLIGRRDLPLAPDPRGGFEMVLLRMLAFRPADTDDAPKPVLKPVGISQATADPATPVAAALVAPARPVAEPVVPVVAQAVPAPVAPAAAVSVATGATSSVAAFGAVAAGVGACMASAQPLDAFGRTDHVGQAHAEAVIDHHHFTVGDQGAVDEHIQRLAGTTFQFHHRTLVELQQVADVDLGAAHFHGNVHRNIQDHVQVWAFEADVLVRPRRAGELFHRQAARTAVAGVATQQRIDIGLAGITGFFQRGSPFIGQGLVLCRGDFVFVSHSVLDKHLIRGCDRHAVSGARSDR